MPTSPTPAACPLCRGPLPDERGACTNCHASPDWVELGQALDFAVRRFQEWNRRGRVGDVRLGDVVNESERRRAEYAALARQGRPLPADCGLPPRDRCWSCGAIADPPPEYCLECGASWTTAAARSLRFWAFLASEIDRHAEAGRLSLNLAHDLKADARERRNALCQKLEKERLPAVTAVTETPRPRRPASNGRTRPDEPAPPRRGVWEILLDPRTIQWLLGLGGALLVIGLVIWLAAVGFFKDPLTVAVALGVGSAGVLFGGWAVILRTRYQTAGRALTLLACLVMPLNLWFYHAHNLITFDGHLWVAALACSLLYAASALVLRDHLFVYVFLGGVALTGLLILGDMHKFEEIAAPSALLVVLGLAAIHAERAFPEGDGPFARSKFGLAFFWSGQALLAAGLLLLLGGQVSGWLYEPLVRGWGLAQPPEVVTDPGLQLLAIGLVLAATYAYVYSDVAVRRVGVYMYLAVFTLLWAEVLIVMRLGLVVQTEAVIAALALTALALNVLRATAARSSETLARAVPPLGAFLAALPVVLGALLHFRATNADFHRLWPYEITWWYVGAMALTAVACRVSAGLSRGARPWVPAAYLFGAAAATLAGGAALLALVGLPTWDKQAAVLMLVPVAYLVASRLQKGDVAERPLVWAAHVATAFMTCGVITASLHVTPQVFEPTTGSPSNLLLALFCAEAAVFYGLASALRKEGWTVYPATAMACGAVWQLLLYWNTAPEYYTLAFAGLGFVLLLAYRLALPERFRMGGLASAAFGSANALMSLAFVAAALLALSRVAAEHATWSLVPLLLVLALLSLLAAGVVRHAAWRPWYVVMSVVEGLLMFVALEVLSELTAWEKAEIFCVVVGALLLALGHWGWHREQAPGAARQSDWVTMALLFGSQLVALPLAVAVICHRTGLHFSVPNELGMLAAGIVMMGSGYACRIKSTTLTGSFLVVLYVVTLWMFAHDLSDVEAAALALAVGGGVVFGVGLLLSVYRDRLLTLPERIKRREGVFRVLTWR